MNSVKQKNKAGVMQARNSRKKSIRRLFAELSRQDKHLKSIQSYSLVIDLGTNVNPKIGDNNL